MNSKVYEFFYNFYPVGQGLFASGTIQQLENDIPNFRWVYDCGTSSSQSLVQNGISNLLQGCDEGLPLDLVTISHFDKDHISGISALLSKCRLDTLILPYMPLWQRLVIAFEEGILSHQSLMEFFVNPVKYLTQLEGADISRILFVLPGGESPSFFPTETDTALYEDGEHWKPEYDREEPRDREEHNYFDAAKTEVYYLKAGSRLHLAGLWEFVPYNDADLAPKATTEFRNAVEEKKKVLLDSNSVCGRNAALKELKVLYDEQFGNSPEKRNTISLFLYGGPIYQSWKNTKLYRCLSNCPVCYSRFFPDYIRERCHISLCLQRCSILYTGDGYLNTPERLRALTKFLQEDRMCQIEVFQVMHHGSKNNWHLGVAQSIKPIVSVFCSDPQRKRPRHPHPRVLRDFWEYGPIQVDKLRGAKFGGLLLLK